MKHVFQVFARDIRRILAVPMAMVTVLGICTIPALYSWFNVAAFWNPYDNTGSLRVAVVNEDKGAHNATVGSLNIGDQVEDSLADNHQLGWTPMDRDQALDEVLSGKSYAAIIIPKDFSADLMTITTGDFHQPKIDYYVNEKNSPITPRITDTGAGTLERQINSQFVSTVSRVAVDAMTKAVDTTSQHADAAHREASNGVTKALDGIDEADAKLDQLIDAVDEGSAKTTEARRSLAAIDAKATKAQNTLNSGIASLNDAQNGLTSLSSGLAVKSASASQTLSQGSQTANAFIGKSSGAVLGAKERTDAALDSAQDALDANTAIIASLKDSEFAGTDAGKTLIEELEQRNEKGQQAVDAMRTAGTNAGDSATAISGAADTIDAANQNTIATMQHTQSALGDNATTGLNSALGSFSSSATTLSGTLAKVGPAVDEADTALDQLDATLDRTATALKGSKRSLAETRTTLNDIGSDMNAASSAGALDRLRSSLGASPDEVAGFVASPTALRTRTVYPLNSYGSAVAPLFTNLALWIGAFTLAMMCRLEVDDDGIDGLTPNQKYLGRWLLFAVLACLQAVIVTTGNLIIGVQTANVPAMYLTTMFIGVVYVSIIYALCISFAHVGRGLTVLLTVLQVPGSSGMYPIEMMPREFQRIYPFLPITHGNNALRETIGGFYGDHYRGYLLILALFAAVAFVVGMTLRPYLNNLNTMVSRQFAATGLLAAEKPIAIRNRYRLDQVLRALSDSTEFHAGIMRRAALFDRWYPRLKRGALAAGIILPIGLMAFSLTTGEKIGILMAWVIWIVAIITFLIGIEFIYDGIQRQIRLGNMDGDELRNVYREQRLHKKPLNPLSILDAGERGGRTPKHSAAAGTARKEA
ncbi:YhgE/Pip domain-containing protein [Bifidobacterium sp. 82T24]|uniref:YhgE/Pip domain-containing protein n=1 Tax=Bifidobacterium pluvialisilvae TaxID=2834436 RepID=UPI001C583D0B|nr:YhgE/Pip domain-containing protein [Bifidobacterium pluvialisilvae]MBW3088491.1 YhgE/Pip domain-containing protein [Bifidobacterium pluvialisilvae]